jgi:hypothetical protein
MIPDTRPVYGSDLEDLRDSLQASAGEMAFLLGVSMIKWTELIKQRHREPIDMPTVEIIARFIDSNPEAAEVAPLLMRVTAENVYDTARKFSGDISKKDFAVSVGRQASSGYRWTTLGGRSSATLNRVLWLYRWNLERARDKAGRQATSPIDEKNAKRDAALSARHRWEKMVREIGMVNGLGDVYATGHWNKPRAREERARRSGEAKAKK